MIGNWKSYLWICIGKTGCHHSEYMKNPHWQQLIPYETSPQKLLYIPRPFQVQNKNSPLYSESLLVLDNVSLYLKIACIKLLFWISQCRGFHGSDFTTSNSFVHAELEKQIYTGKQQALRKWAFSALPKQYKAAHTPHLNNKGEARMTASSVEGWRSFWKGRSSSPSSLSLEERNVFLEAVGQASQPNHKYLSVNIQHFQTFPVISRIPKRLGGKHQILWK